MKNEDKNRLDDIVQTYNELDEVFNNGDEDGEVPILLYSMFLDSDFDWLIEKVEKYFTEEE